VWHVWRAITEIDKDSEREVKSHRENAPRKRTAENVPRKRTTRKRALERPNFLLIAISHSKIFLSFLLNIASRDRHLPELPTYKERKPDSDLKSRLKKSFIFSAKLPGLALRSPWRVLSIVVSYGTESSVSRFLNLPVKDCQLLCAPLGVWKQFYCLVILNCSFRKLWLNMEYFLPACQATMQELSKLALCALFCKYELLKWLDKIKKLCN
jgi:hypothetical protein